jgi:beta-glucanase (GH16 family)
MTGSAGASSLPHGIATSNDRMHIRFVTITAALCAALVALPASAQAHVRRHHHKHRTHHSAVFSSKRRGGGGSGAGTTTTTCANETLAPKPGGGSWTCAFDDEFDSSTGDASSLNTNWWTPQVSATSGYLTGQYPYYACYLNSPNNISVSNGALHLTARQESAPVNCGGYMDPYTSGMVTTAGHFSQTYGRFEVRAQLPPATAAGLQETLWLWPVNSSLYGSWPASGEVDFSEFYSEYSNLDVPYIHYDYSASNSATNTNVVTNYCPINVSQYNNYAVVWEPGSFQITVNGTTCLTDNYRPSNVSSPAPFNQPFMVALTQALGVGTNAFNPSTTPLPATTNIDYVRVWK